MRFREKYNFLSNFYPHEIVYDGEIYPTSEHAYQAAKFIDPDIKKKIRECNTPTHSKQMARTFSENIDPDWNSKKLKVMYDILHCKFNDPTLENKLLSIDVKIVEHNNWGDTFWGVCNGQGKNNLGKILERIKKEKEIF